MAEHKKCGCGCNGCSHPISQSVGELVIQITRNTWTIQQPLPYALWGSIYIDTSYGVVLQPYLTTPYTTANLTVTSAVVGSTVVFTYSDGLNSDTITVTVPNISNISYVEAVTNLKTNYMNSCFMVFNCNAANDAPFFSNEGIYRLQDGGMFFLRVGADQNKNSQVVIPSTRRQINNSVVNMIELYLRNEPIKAENVWIHQFPWFNQELDPFVPVTFSLTVFYSERVNMNEEREMNYKKHRQLT